MYLQCLSTFSPQQKGYEPCIAVADGVARACGRRRRSRSATARASSSGLSHRCSCGSHARAACAMGPPSLAGVRTPGTQGGPGR